MGKQLYSDEQKKKIFSLRKSGRTEFSISKEMGMSMMAVRRILTRGEVRERLPSNAQLEAEGFPRWAFSRAREMSPHRRKMYLETILEPQRFSLAPAPFEQLETQFTKSQL